MAKNLQPIQRTFTEAKEWIEMERDAARRFGTDPSLSEQEKLEFQQQAKSLTFAVNVLNTVFDQTKKELIDFLITELNNSQKFKETGEARKWDIQEFVEYMEFIRDEKLF